MFLGPAPTYGPLMGDGALTDVVDDHGGDFVGAEAGEEGAFGGDFGGGGDHHGVFDPGGGFGLSDVAEEHGGGADGGHGVGLGVPGVADFGGGAHGAEHAVAARVDAADGGVACAALGDGSDVGEDVAEEVAGDDDVEVFGVADELHADVVDGVVFALDVGVFGVADFFEGAGPEVVDVGEEGAFSAEGEFAAPVGGGGEVEGVAEAAFDLEAAVDHAFFGDFLGGAFEEGAAGFAVEAAGVLAHDDVVDFLVAFAAEVAFDAGH